MSSVYYRELRNKLRKNRFFSLIVFILKFVFSIAFVLFLPIFAFLFFIFVEPREIPKLNTYLINLVNNLDSVKKLSIDKARLSLDSKLRLNYTIENAVINFENNTYLKIPSITVTSNLFNIAFKKHIINSIILKHIYIDTKSNNFTTSEKTIKNNNFLKSIYDTADFINKKNIPIKSIIIKDSKIKFDDTNNNINYILINLDSFKNSKTINFLTSINFDNNSKKFIANNLCKFYQDKTIECNVNIKDFTTNSFSKFYKDEYQYSDYVNNIKTNFNGNVFAKFSDYVNLDYAKFEISSKNGEIGLISVFGNKFKFKELYANGTAKNNFKSITIDNFNVDILDQKYNSKLNLSLNADENQILFNININDIDVNKINTFWPVFLDDKGIRDWVIEHISNGYIKDANAKMEFHKNVKNNEFDLFKINSEVNIVGAKLDIYETIPVIENVNAKAIFTENGMNIYVNSANFYNTKLKNGLIYSNFKAKKSILDIKADSIGDANELFYFIDKNSKDKIDENVKKFLNGQAKSNINVKVNLDSDDIDLKDIYIKAKSNITKNNSIVLKNDLSINLEKKFNSNIFNIVADLSNTDLYFPFLNIKKSQNAYQKLSFDIDIKNNDEVLIDNFKTDENNYINFTGNALIENSDLVDLQLNDIIFGNNSFNFEYTLNNNIPHINIFGNFVVLNNDLKKSYENLEKLFFENSNNGKLDLQFKTNISEIFYKKRRYKNFVSNVAIEDNNVLNSNIKFSYSKEEFANLNVNSANGGISDFKLEVSDIGKLLDFLDINNNIMGGKLKYSGSITKDFSISGDLSITNGINIIKSNVPSRAIKAILNNKSIPIKTKKAIMGKNIIKFSELWSYIEINKNTINIKDLILYGNFIGIDITGNGKFYFKNGKTNLKGVIVPAGTINRLFFIDKIPLVNTILLGEKNGGLFGITYSFSKENYDLDYDFNINKTSVFMPGFLRELIR